MFPSEWRTFLEQLSRDILAVDRFGPIMPDPVIATGWLGYEPATESAIVASEFRLGRELPPSLRSFYAVTNGWRTVGCFIWNVLPVEELGWLEDRDPHLYSLAQQVEDISGPFKNDPDDLRLNQYREEQGTRVKRSFAITSQGDSSTWLLDPETILTDGEWEGGAMVVLEPCDELA